MVVRGPRMPPGNGDKERSPRSMVPRPVCSEGFNFLPIGILSRAFEALMNSVLYLAMRPSRPGGTWTTERLTNRGCPAGRAAPLPRDDAARPAHEAGARSAPRISEDFRLDIGVRAPRCFDVLCCKSCLYPIKIDELGIRVVNYMNHGYVHRRLVASCVGGWPSRCAECRRGVDGQCIGPESATG